MSTAFVPTDILGRCDVCKGIQTIPAEAVDVSRACPSPGCKGVLTHHSFGYDESGRKVRWLGPDGEWTDTKPTESFILGGLAVIP